MRLLTPPGLSGVAVVAFADAERDAVYSCLTTRSGRRWSGPDTTSPARPRLAALRLGETAVDEVLVVDRGREGLELHLHGSPAVVQALGEHFTAAGRDDGGAESEPADCLLRNALAVEQLDLALEQRAVDFEAFLIELAALPPAEREPLGSAARERSRVALAHVEPHRVVLAGARNAGKSTLFNRLLFRERALTGELPGLTRDPVREVTALAGYPIELVDTAGEGAALGDIDERAIAAGRELRRGATLLLVVDGSRGPTQVDREALGQARDVLVVATKTDLPAASWPGDFAPALRCSGLADEPARLRAAMGELLRAHRGLPVAGPVGGPAALARAQWARLLAVDGSPRS